MIDAGHYGKYNHSPCVSEYWESDMTWKLHLLLKSELEKYGIQVGTTRANKETDLEVYQRGTKAKGYDIFISLHSNAVGGGANEKIDHPIVIRQNADTKSEMFCQAIADKVAELMGTKEKGRTGTRVQSNGAEYYGVLRGSKAVGCNQAYIIEHSFHSATEPCKWLLKDDNLKKLAIEEAKIIAAKLGATKKEEEEITMTKEELIELIKENVPKEKIYHYFTELPDYAKKKIFVLYKSGIFSGKSSTDLGLTLPEIRTLCWIYAITPTDKLVKVTDEELKKVFG